MKNQTVFQRYEIKYQLDRRQQQAILAAMAPYMEPDEYSHSSIRNLYLDTPDFRLIRRSLERPVYKEKLRVRSYRRAGLEEPVFVELKKKYGSVVYKRRLAMPQREALDCIAGSASWPDTQIGGELAYAAGFYAALRPAVFLSYERDSYRGVEDEAFRVTFDTEIRYRQETLTLNSDPPGLPSPPPRPGAYGGKDGRQPAPLDGPRPVGAGALQNLFFQVWNRLSKYPAFPAERRKKICLTACFKVFLTPP